MKILITGSGKGLGTCLVIGALKRGHEVYASVHDITSLSSELKDCIIVYGNKVHIFEMDVTKDDQIKQVIDHVEKISGSLDGIINNAAILIEREATIADLDLSAMYKSFDVNTIGTMRVVQNSLACLYKGEKQVIVNISSEAGTIINAFPTNYPYSMSKAALNMFTERLREYLKEKDILVYAVHPGWMRTNMGGCDAPADPNDIASGILDIMERKKKIYSKIAFIDSTGRPMPL